MHSKGLFFAFLTWYNRKVQKSFLHNSHTDLLHALDKVNLEVEEEDTREKSRLFGLPYINLSTFPIDLNVLGIFTEQEAKDLESVPFYRENNDLRIGTVNPRNPLLGEKLKSLGATFAVTLYVISKPSYEKTLRFYSKVLTPKPLRDEAVRLNPEIKYESVVEELKQEEAQVGKSATELLSNLFGIAQSFEASDIHLEPEDHLVKVRFRVDGVLQDLVHLAKALQKPLVSRIKILSKLKLNIENLPQDGRLTFWWGERPIDVRVSSLPSAYGEGIVMRLLGTGASNLKFEDLGFKGKAYTDIEHELSRPNGMIITTGPTGSGKTTTLYAFLNELNDPGVKIITLEDPVEYKLPGIQQTPIDHHVDFNFAKGLRAILRQDPDIVMVGEIRDQETAETALQAALTGHIVLSTLHTNDASGAIPRLLAMGAKPFTIAPALNAVIAQRLVRKLCEHCKKPVALDANLQARVKALLDAIPKAAALSLPEKWQFYHSPGCSQCHNLGYKGRIGIYEVMIVNDALKELVLKQATMGEMKKQAIADGMVSMAQDGLLKALEGITDVEEVFRVAGE